MRWLAHRGGALDFREFAAAQPRRAVSGRGGARRRPGDPARRRHAGARHAVGVPVRRPAARQPHRSQRLLGRRRRHRPAGAGHGRVRPRGPRAAGGAPASPGTSEHGIALREQGGYLHALEGPFGDHTGYYNEQEWFPVFEIERLTHRRDPIYHSTYTGKPPDEPAVLGVALNEVFVPILQKQFPGDHRLLPAARGLQLPARDHQHQEALPRARQAGDVRSLELPAPVHVHEVHRRHRRRRRRPPLARRRLGDHDADGSGARHPARRPDADRLPRLRLAGLRARRQDGPRRDLEVARRDGARMGPADPRRRRRRGAGRRGHRLARLRRASG